MVEAVPISTKVVVILVIPKAAPVEEEVEEEVEEATRAVAVEVIDASRAILKVPAGASVLEVVEEEEGVLHRQTRVGMTMEAAVEVAILEVEETEDEEVDLVSEVEAAVDPAETSAGSMVT